MMYALLTLTNKLGTALSSVVLVILGTAHFNQAPDAANTPQALGTLTFLFVALPPTNHLPSIPHRNRPSTRLSLLLPTRLRQNFSPSIFFNRRPHTTILTYPI